MKAGTKTFQRNGVLPLVVVFFLQNWATAYQNDHKIVELPAREQRWALVIGIGKYDNPAITELHGDADAKALAAALKEHAGFPANQIFLLANGSEGSEPTQTNIIETIGRLRKYVPAEGLLLFAFSGHGVTIGKSTYLLPKTVGLSLDDSFVLSQTALSTDSIMTALRDGGVGQVIMLIDSCREKPIRSAAAIPETLPPETVEDFNFRRANVGVKAFAQFFATSPGKEAFQDPKSGLGFFMSAVTDAFDCKTIGGSGLLYLSDLIHHVTTSVEHNVQESLGKVQEPYPIVEGYNAEQLVLASCGNKRQFWYYHQWDAPGRRDWKQIDAKSWEETFPGGRVDIFDVTSPHAEVDGIPGSILMRKDRMLYVFIPQANQNDKRLRARTTEQGSWLVLGEINDSKAPE